MSTKINENMTLWDEPDSVYLTELDNFALQLFAKFPHAKIAPCAYSGGVPGMGADLGAGDYAIAKEWLTNLFGVPKVVERWHPAHTEGVPILRFHKTAEMEHNKMSHVTLIPMMQRTDKKFTTISWM